MKGPQTNFLSAKSARLAPKKKIISQLEKELSYIKISEEVKNTGPIDMAWYYESLLFPESMSLDEWANTYRMLSSESSSSPGKWVSYEYQRKMMNVLTEGNYHFVIFLTSTQISKTEIINNFIGQKMHLDPSNIIVVHPTVEMAKVWLKMKLDPFIRDNKVVREKLTSDHRGTKPTDVESWSNAQNVILRNFYGGSLSIIGGNSPAAFAQRSAKYVIFDDLDRFSAAVGKEGSPVLLGLKRTTTHEDYMLILSSSPSGTEDTSQITRYYNQSDQMVLKVRCPFCRKYQQLVFENLIPTLDKSEEPPIVTSIAYRCQQCFALIPENKKLDMLEDKPKWITTNPRHSKTTGKRIRRRMLGLFIDEIYSPWKTWTALYEDFLLAERGGETELTTFYNTSLARLRKSPGQGANWELLKRKQEDFPYGEVHNNVYFLTGGIDVQDNRLEYSVYGWGKHEECWQISHTVFYGNTDQLEVWDKLGEYLYYRFPQPTQNNSLKVIAVCIDTGHKKKRAYAFARKHSRIVYAVKGGAKFDAPEIQRPRKKDFNEEGDILKRSLKLWTLGVSSLKVSLYNCLNLEAVGPGYLHFSADNDDEFWKGLCSERLVTHRSGAREWVREYRRNEPLDCLVYAYAAALIAGIEMIPWDTLPAHTKQIPNAEHHQQQEKQPVIVSPSLTNTPGTTPTHPVGISQDVQVWAGNRRVRGSLGSQMEGLRKQYY